MKHKTRYLVAPLAALALVAGGALHADVSSGNNGAPNFIVVVNIIEGPDPIPQSDDGEHDGTIWSKYDLDPWGLFASRPSVGLLPGSRHPLAIWAHDVGSDHDIAFNEWDGSGWRRDPVFLTSALTDELDPRLFIEPDGSLFAVWWEDAATDAVYLAARNPGSSVWSPGWRILEPGRRPSVARRGTELVVAYERDRAGGSGQEVVVATQRIDGSWDVVSVATTDRSERLDVRVHSREGRLWVEWNHGGDRVGISELIDGAWVAPNTVPRPDRTGQGAALLREVIRSGLRIR